MQVKQGMIKDEEYQDVLVQGLQLGKFQIDFSNVPYKQYYLRQLQKVNFSGLSDEERLVAVKIMCPMVQIQVYISPAEQVYVGYSSKWYHVGHAAMVRARLQKFFSRLEPYFGLYLENYLEPWSPRFEGLRQ